MAGSQGGGGGAGCGRRWAGVCVSDRQDGGGGCVVGGGVCGGQSGWGRVAMGGPIPLASAPCRWPSTKRGSRCHISSVSSFRGLPADRSFVSASSQKEAFLPVPRVAPDTAQQSPRQAPNLSGQTGPVSSPPSRSAPDLTGPWEPALSSCPRVDRKLRLGRLRPRFHGSDVCVRLSGAGCENGQSVRTKTDMKGRGNP